jgi:imidazoleglycerol-phosphate dehydratase
MSAKDRTCSIERKTSETSVVLSINLDKNEDTSIETGVPFLDHMLYQLSKHGSIGIQLKANGDIHIDDHHTVEDVGICLGQAFKKCLGDKSGIYRFGHAYAPLDESLSRSVVDFSGRPGAFITADFTKNKIGKFDVELVEEFFVAFSNNALATLHIDNLKGKNTHHQVESMFKAFGISVRNAISFNDKMHKKIPSSKGVL